jgi:hypothetical protein
MPHDNSVTVPAITDVAFFRTKTPEHWKPTDNTTQ